MPRFFQHLGVALIIALVLAFSGCVAAGDAGTINLRRVPAWIEPSPARTYTQAEVAAGIREILPFVAIDTTDATFTAVSHEWLTQTIEWTRDTAVRTGLGLYVGESWDCDKFALAFALPANIAAQRARVSAQPLVARIYVRQLVPFAGVRDGIHALNAFLSDRGIFVYEPQNRTLVPLAQYPNTQGIFRVRLGG